MNGNGMGGIDGQGSQHRKDVLHEPRIQPFAVGPGDVRDIDDGNAVGAQFVAQAAPAFLLLVEQQLGFPIDGDKLLCRRQSVLAGGVDAVGHLAFQSGNTHHVKLVKIGG